MWRVKSGVWSGECGVGEFGVGSVECCGVGSGEWGVGSAE